MGSNMLEFVGEIPVPAIPKTVITRRYLDDHVHMARWPADVYDIFCGKVEEATPECVLRVHKLICLAYTDRIATKISPRPEITLGQMLFVVGYQRSGESGIIRTDGSGTLSFVRDKNDKLRNIVFGWSPTLDDWYAKDFPFEREVPWGYGVQAVAP